MIILLFLLVFLIFPSPSLAAAPTVYWGAWIDGSTYGLPNDSPWDLVSSNGDTTAMYVSHTVKKPSIIHFGTSFQRGGVFQSFPTSAMNAIRTYGAIPMLDLGTWNCCGTSQGSFTNDAVASGTYDSYITSFAQSAKTWGKPFFLRLDWEMNGWWQFPWVEGTNGGVNINGNTPGSYVRMWKHVHDIFSQVGASNVTWVWCPNVYAADTSTQKYAPLSQVYPGNSYVDWTCLDGYNKYSTWLTFSQLFSGTSGSFLKNSYADVNALSGNKPMMIGEFASQETGGSKAAWITSALQAEIPNNFPNIKAIVWFNWDDGAGLPWPIESSQTAQDAFKNSILTQNYAANLFGNITASPIAPLASSTPTPTPTPTPTGTPILTVTFQLPGPADLTLRNSVGVETKFSGITSGTPVTLTGIVPGTYDVLVKDSAHLRKKLGTITIVTGANTAPAAFGSVALTAGDFNGDNILDLFDVALILAKYDAISVAVTSTNQKYDINLDNKIDLVDVSSVLANFTSLRVNGD